jgi:hypothetical protein
VVLVPLSDMASASAIHPAQRHVLAERLQLL